MIIVPHLAFEMFSFAELCFKVSHSYAVSKASQNSKTKCLHRVIKNTGKEYTTLYASKFILSHFLTNTSFCVENHCVTSAYRLVLLFKEPQQAVPMCMSEGKGRERDIASPYCTVICKASSVSEWPQTCISRFHLFSLYLSLSALRSAVICYLLPVCFCSLFPWFLVLACLLELPLMQTYTDSV